MKQACNLCMITIWLLIIGSCSDGKLMIDDNIEPMADDLPGLSCFQDKCISLIDSCIIAYDQSRLYVSKNLGQSWVEGPLLQKEDLIRFAYVFEDGTLFYCTDDGCYYSADYKAVSSSIIIDIDGSLYVPEAKYHNFSAYEHDGFRSIIDGKEILCWGSYNNEETVNPGFRSRIWMTSDKGRTVKCTFRFGDNLKARHVHAINYNSIDKSFWAQTGDSDYQCHWLKGVYDNQTDDIKWSLVGSGLDYKTGNMQFFDGWIYASRDSYPGGVFRVRYQDAGDLSKAENVFITPNDCISVYIRRDGAMVILLTTTNSTINPRNIFFSSDQKQFLKIEGPIPDNLLDYGPSIFYNTWGFTPDGLLLSGIRTRAKSSLSEWHLTPSIWLNDVICDYE